MIVCSNCQTQNPDGSEFCNRCGQPLSAPDGASPDDTASSDKTPVNMGLISLAVVAVLLVIIGLVLLNWQRERRTTSAEATRVAADVNAAATLKARELVVIQGTRSAETTSVFAGLAATQTAAPTQTAMALATRYARGAIAVDIGDWTMALLEYRAVFEVDPEYADVRVRLAEVIARLTPSPTPNEPLTVYAIPDPGDTYRRWSNADSGLPDGNQHADPAADGQQFTADRNAPADRYRRAGHRNVDAVAAALSHADTDGHLHATPYSNAPTHIDLDANADANSRAISDTDSDIDRHNDARIDGDRDIYADSDVNAIRYAD